MLIIPLVLLSLRAVTIESRLKLQSIDGHTKVSTLIGSGFESSSDGTGAFAGLDTPISLAMDNTESTIYATDYSGQGIISKVTIATAYKSTFGSGKKLNSLIMTHL